MPIKEIKPVSTWSYSRFQCYDQCPFKFKLRYIDKRPEPESSQMARGTAIHLLAQEFVEGKTKKIPTELRIFKSQFSMLREAKAQCEGEWGFNVQWEPTAWMAKDVWLRVKCDAIYQKAPGHYVVVDHKTGRIYEGHKDQLQLYALATFLKFPDAQLVTSQDWYLDQDAMTEANYERNDMTFIREHWETCTRPMFKDTIYPAKPGWACRFCHFRKSNSGICPF